MELPIIDKTLKELLDNSLLELEKLLQCDIITYFGTIVEGQENKFLDIVEDLANDKEKRDNLAIILTTTGGSIVAVERYVNIVRHNYDKVIFIVPDYAYSAGTIFCMSGDDIWMDYFSVLGPIDPQVLNKEGHFVPALGYLDKINELIQKAKDNELTNAEFIILKEFDLAELKAFEQAQELTKTLLKDWLVKYKFKNWDKHSSNGQVVTQNEKIERAEEIASALSDNKRWQSHNRPINVEALEKLKLKITDYSKWDERKQIRNYYKLIKDFVNRNKFSIFVHTRKYLL